MPDEPEVPEVKGLLALMALTDARRAARASGGALVPLPDQDRTGWDPELITEGHAIVRACLRRDRPGPYQLLAAINAVHTDAACAAETDWTQIVQLYDQLHTVTPTPVVALNRAIAVAVVDGPAAALAIVNRLDLAGDRAFHAARAGLLRREHRSIEAVQAYTRALDLAAGPAEQAYLRSRRADLLSSWFTQQPHQERPRVRLRCCTPVRRPLNPCLATTRPHQRRSLEAALGPTRWT
jgi:RNA polymerase sigma-70 factor (ECF subfamily)